MKFRTLPVKRRPVPKGIFKRLSAVTQRKQRVAATADPAMIGDDGSSKISRALTIIFLIHIVAIGLIFVHQRFLDGRAPAESTAKTISPAATTTAAKKSGLPMLQPGDKGYVISQGDNYSRIAAKLGVSENDLRALNNDADLPIGRSVKVPPQRIVAQESPEITAIRKQATPTAPTNELVEAIDVSQAPKAILVKTIGKPQTVAAATNAAPVKTTPKATTPSAANSDTTYAVQTGDSVWRIANRYKISQADLMKANGISDARKIKPGMTLKIPH